MQDQVVTLSESQIRSSCDLVWGEKLNETTMKELPNHLVAQLANSERSPDGISTGYALGVYNCFGPGPVFSACMNYADQFVDNLGLDPEFAVEVKKGFRSASTGEKTAW